MEIVTPHMTKPILRRHRAIRLLLYANRACKHEGVVPVGSNGVSILEVRKKVYKFENQDEQYYSEYQKRIFTPLLNSYKRTK